MSVINTNTISLNAQRNLQSNSATLATTIQRLSSGLRINSARDDAAGLAISERFSTQIRGLNVASRNANDGISLAQTAEGALGEISNNLQRIRELAVQSRNATNSASDRAALQAEVSQLKSEIDRVANQTSFNGLNLLDGSFTAEQFQVGANQGQTITVAAIVDANIATLGSWTSVGTPAIPTVTAASGAFTGATSTAASQTFQFTVAGVNVVNATSAASGEVIAAADIDTGLTTNAAALATAGVTFTGTAAAGTLVFTRADGADLTIAFTETYGTGDPTFATSGFVGTNTSGTPAVAGTAQTGFAALDISTVAGADAAILAMDGALTAVNSARADLGAVQNRFSSVISNLNTTSENLTASRSRIRDADYARETAELTRTQILQQAGTAMLAQANQIPQNVLSLLR